MKKGVLTDFTEFAGVFMWILQIAEHLRTTAFVMPSKWFLPTKIDEIFEYEICLLRNFGNQGKKQIKTTVSVVYKEIFHIHFGEGCDK